MRGVFAKSKEMEAQIESYLAKIQTASLIFSEGMKDYLEGDLVSFEERVFETISAEREADGIKSDIKRKLYSHMLIPDARGDVLGLLETLDEVLSTSKKIMHIFSIEHPVIPELVRSDFQKMVNYTQQCMEQLANAANCYFTDIRHANEYINKVHYYEGEVDKLEEKIKRAVFNSKEIKSLSNKMHLRYFVEKLAMISDQSEDVCDRLEVYVIKRLI
jgi:uncharacterized protein